MGNITRWDPRKIFPSKPGHVRLNGTHFRDTSQSNLGGEMHQDHMEMAAPIIDGYHAQIPEFPGVQETGGGTTGLFDLRTRGRHPFLGQTKLAELMPHTPLMALIRSNCGISMGDKPKDVVSDWIHRYYDAGITVFRNFHAHNDLRHHAHVAEAVHECGGHLQIAYSWAILDKDPTIYNAMAAVRFFREAVRDYNPHSLVIKDPSGVLTPEMARLVTAEIKSTFPDIPFGIHTHHQAGYAAATCVAAAKAGANFVDCSPTPLSEGAAQTPMRPMFRMLEDEGLDLGFPNLQARRAAFDAMVATDTKLIPVRELYAQGKVPRLPTSLVEISGIAGGQRSVLDEELSKAGLAARSSDLDMLTGQIRSEGGGAVCQVTPVADIYAREAVRVLMGGDPDKGFYPGFAGILTGESGLLPVPVDKTKHMQALRERTEATLKKVVKDVDQRNAMLEKEGAIDTLVKEVYALSVPSQRRLMITQMQERVNELEEIKTKPELLKSLNRKLLRANGTNGTPRTVDSEIVSLQAKLEKMRGAQKETDITDAEYEKILRGNPSDAIYASLTEKSPALKALPKDSVVTLLKAAAPVTCCAADLLPPGLDRAKEELFKLAAEHKFHLPVDLKRFGEYVAIQAMFAGENAIKFFKNYPHNVAATWPHPDPKMQEERTKKKFTPRELFELKAELPEHVGHKEIAEKLRDVLHDKKLDASTSLLVVPGMNGKPAHVSVAVDEPDGNMYARLAFTVQGVIKDLGGTVPRMDRSRAANG